MSLTAAFLPSAWFTFSHIQA